MAHTKSTADASRLSARGLVLLVGLWTTVIWMGTDMYLPALPLMDEALGTTESFVNVTLLAFTLAGPIGAIVGGPISDKVGRFVPTLAGGLAFALGNAACACAPSIGVLIVLRLIAGLGGGVSMATVMAILKDALEGDKLDSAVTVTQSLAIVGPIVAPFLGSLMIGFVGWRGIFGLLALMGAVLVVVYFRVGETLPVERRADVSIVGSLGLIAGIAKNHPFMVLLVTLSLPALCFGVFMTACSYVYLDEFGLSYVQYSFMYAATSVASIVAPFVYGALQKQMGNKRVIWICVLLLALSGLWTMLAGGVNATFFVLGTVPFALAEGMARPCAYLVLLRAESERAGSASALINFTIGVLVALGTPIASLPWPNHIVAVGISTLLAGLLATALFGVLLFVLKSRIVDEG